jgi:hypothetical protein
MSDSFDDLPAMRHLRDGLYEAAAREARPVLRRRRLRRTGALALVALSTAGVATGASLLATGDPVPDVSGVGGRYLPASPGSGRIAVVADDPALGSRWGVASYTARNGERCVVAGQVRGTSLGLVRNDVFHPYALRTSGPCSGLPPLPLVWDARFFPGPQPRSVVYGRVSRRVHSIAVEVDGQHYRGAIGHGGAFMFLFQGEVTPAEVKLTPW